MGIEVPNVITPNHTTSPEIQQQEKNIPKPQIVHKTPAPPPLEEEMSTEDMKIALDALARAASVFNKRLSFSVNESIGRIVVKIIDNETDKVIKEIPEPAMQRLLARLKEAVGLIVDETI
ncbi:MAG: flagellar protein FlaG [Spirochaetales bacterium]|nr:flagellar protein FlaG [Spirochaetales bacterium]